MAQNIIYSPWGGANGPWLCLMTSPLLISLVELVDCFPLFLHFLISLIKLTHWLKFFWKTKSRLRTCGTKTIGFCCLSAPPSPWYSSLLRRDRYRRRKRIKFWTKRLITDLAEELCCSSISVPVFPKALREWADNCYGDFLLKWGGCERESISCSIMSSSAILWTVAARLFRPWGSPGKNTGVGSHSLLQRICLTQGLLHCRQILYHLSQGESPKWGIVLRNLGNGHRVGNNLKSQV